jgi:hypothetical protein
MHNAFQKQDINPVNRDISWALFDFVSILDSIVPFDSEELALDLRRRSIMSN